MTTATMPATLTAAFVPAAIDDNHDERVSALTNWSSEQSRTRDAALTTGEAKRLSDALLGASIVTYPAPAAVWVETAKTIGVKIDDVKVTRAGGTAAVLSAMAGESDDIVSAVYAAGSEEVRLATRAVTVLGTAAAGAVCMTRFGRRDSIVSALESALVAHAESVETLAKGVKVSDKVAAGLFAHAESGRLTGESLRIVTAARDALTRAIDAAAE